MKRKYGLMVLLCLSVSVYAFAGKDTLKIKYVYSYLSINAGYGQNFVPSFSGIPWFANHGDFVSISVFKAIKESYFGLTGMAWYTTSSAFQGGQSGRYIPIAGDTTSPRISSFKQGIGGHYRFFSAMGGLGLKLPEHTTRYTIELRIMIGPVLCRMPSISYTTIYVLPPSYIHTENIYTEILPCAAISLGVNAGASYGYKLNRHWGIMGNCDVFFSSVTFKPTVTSIPSAISPEPYVHADISYLAITAGLVYTFGKMTANFTY